MSLRTKFILAVIMLLFVLVGLIFFVIEKREVSAIYEEQLSRGFLEAEYLIQLNYDEFVVFRDVTGAEENIEKQISDKLIYIVFYDANNSPFAGNEFIKAYEKIYANSNFAEAELEGNFFSSRIELEDRETAQALPILEIEAPIYVEGSPRRWGSVKIGLSMEEARAEIRDTHIKLVLIAGLGLLFGIVGSILLSRGITTSLKKLVDGTVRISKGDFSHRIDLSSHDELGNLATSFNKMSEQLFLTKRRMEEASKKLVHAEKLASIGRLSASIAHEIRNPLTSVKLNVQKVAESECWGEVERGHLDITQEGIDHIENFIKELLNFTRVSELNFLEFSMEQIIDSSLKIITDQLELKNIQVKKEYEEGLPPVYVDGDKMRLVIVNILRNAYEELDEGGEIDIILSLVEEEEEKKISIEISDNGKGIAESEWENIFEPFYTTKSVGIGLGLANAQKIVEQHNGSIRIIKKEGRGACFEILIPCGEVQ
ncbi:MAG: ATP-binding protein [Candidatus Aminicenantes bacterium]